MLKIIQFPEQNERRGLIFKLELIDLISYLVPVERIAKCNESNEDRCTQFQLAKRCIRYY